MFEQTFKNINDVLGKGAGCATELDYTEQTSWILFLKYFDDADSLIKAVREPGIISVTAMVLLV